MNSIPRWRQFEQDIQTIFGRNPRAKVTPDAEIKGKSGRTRKLELLIEYPFEIEFGESFKVEVPIRIAVDCKDHKRPINIKLVDQFFGQMDDIGAHLGIMVATAGFDAGAEAAANSKKIALVNATWDLMRLARGFHLPDFFHCKACADSEGDYFGVVDWIGSKSQQQSEQWPRLLQGVCDRCNAPHIFCPDCGGITGILDIELDDCIECRGDCGRVFIVSHGRDGDSYDLETMDGWDCQILKACIESKGKLPNKKVEKILSESRWQYWSVGHDPLIAFTERGYAEWDDDSEYLLITDFGVDFYNDHLTNAKMSYYGW